MIKLDNKGKLFQWDSDRAVEVEGCEVVHFAHHGTTDDALVVEVKKTENGRLFAPIPNLLLQQPLDIDVWRFCDGHTIEYRRFKVESRPKPSDYMYAPTEVLTIESIKKWVLEQLERVGAATDYALLSNKPSINGHELVNQVTLEDIGIVPMTDADVDKLFD